MGTKERLRIGANLLETIDQHRARSQNPGRGCGIERRIIDRELRELEKDILADPGALVSQLVHIRKRSSR